MDFFQFVDEFSNAPLGFFSNPGRRLYWVYLIISVTIFTIVLIIRKDFKTIKKSLEHKDSILLDLKLWIVNIGLRLWIGSLSLLTVTGLSLKFMHFYYLLFPNWNPLPWSYYITTTLLTFSSFIIFDFLRFFQHYLMHNVPFLWNFHQVHHSATYLTPLTLYRMHPVENLVSAFRRVIGQSFVFSSFLFLFGPGINAYDILGINILSFIANIAISNLRHSPIPISFGFFEKIFLSPAQHLIHHSSSPKLMNSNYGVVLSIWDQCLGSFIYYQNQKIEWGLRNPRFHTQSVSHQLITPFTLSFQYLKFLVKKASIIVIHTCLNKLNKSYVSNYKETL